MFGREEPDQGKISKALRFIELMKQPLKLLTKIPVIGQAALFVMQLLDGVETILRVLQKVTQDGETR